MNTESKRKYYLLAFLLGCLPFLVSAVSFLARNGWIFYLYGDFNTQQIPLRLYIRENISDLRFPQFDFNAGSGLDYIAAYSPYHMFSPFTFIYALIPDNAAVYALPFMMALKFGACAIAAYIYISRFCKTKEYAVTGAVLYTYSGFQMANLIFEGIDGLVFFPLLLAALESAVNEKRRGIFGITAALCAFTNYYMFGTEVIFLIIYFLVRLTDKTFRISIKDFFCLALESILGVMAAGIVLVPSAAVIIYNPRMAEHFSSIKDMLVYESPWRYPRILQSIFMIPDMMGDTNFFPDSSGGYPYGSRWSSLGAYTPMFGISGVAAFILAKRKSWQTRLIAVCTVIAFVPVLNSLFSMGSSLYYARWMFALTLMMSAMTACALEDDPKYFRPGLIINAAAVLLIVIFGLAFPIEKIFAWTTGPYNNTQKWVHIALTLSGIIFAFVILFKIKRDRSYAQTLAVFVAVFAFMLSEVTILFDMAGTKYYPEVAFDTYASKDVYPDIEQTEQGYRIDTEYLLENKMLVWGTGAIYTFNSIVSPYMVRYQDATGIDKDQITGNYPTQCLMSAKYYLSYYLPDSGPPEELPTPFGNDSFRFSKLDGAYLYYENENYIPMGFCYEYCISEEDFLSLDLETRKCLMLKAMVVSDASAVSEFLTPIPANEIYTLDDEEFSAECAKRAEKTAYSYTTDDDSYYAEITLDEPELVFFSVAYDKGFTAYVDGEETELINANFGFQAVPVPAGTHKIRVKYHSVWRDMGFVLSIIGICGLTVYTLLCYVLNRKRKN